MNAAKLLGALLFCWAFVAGGVFGFINGLVVSQDPNAVARAGTRWGVLFFLCLLLITWVAYNNPGITVGRW